MSEWIKYIEPDEYVVKGIIYDMLSENDTTTPHTYDGVSDVVYVLSQMEFRDLRDLEMEVERTVNDWVDDKGYLVVPDGFMDTPPIPLWQDGD